MLHAKFDSIPARIDADASQIDISAIFGNNSLYGDKFPHFDMTIIRVPGMPVKD